MRADKTLDLALDDTQLGQFDQGRNSVTYSTRLLPCARAYANDEPKVLLAAGSSSLRATTGSEAILRKSCLLQIASLTFAMTDWAKRSRLLRSLPLPRNDEMGLN